MLNQGSVDSWGDEPEDGGDILALGFLVGLSLSTVCTHHPSTPMVTWLVPVPHCMMSFPGTQVIMFLIVSLASCPMTHTKEMYIGYTAQPHLFLRDHPARPFHLSDGPIP